MNDEQTVVVIQTLLSKGFVKPEREVNLARINEALASLSYDAIELPHNGVIVLRDRSKGPILPPWKEKSVEEASRIFKAIAQQTHFNEDSPTVDLLVECNYILRDGDRLVFTERALVQFANFIEEIGGRFRKCKLCGFLSDEGEFHKACKSSVIGD